MKRQTFSGFCGPAVLQHFINIYGYDVEQEKIAEAVSTISSVKDNGMTPEELGLALKILFPDLALWLKYNALWQDVQVLTSKYSKPANHGVALDIQCFFVDSDVLIPGTKEQIEVAKLEDNGHYVLVTNVYDNGQVRLIDPSIDYVRYIHQNIILMRWWDVDSNILERPLMIVTKKEDIFPQCLDMRISPS